MSPSHRADVFVDPAEDPREGGTSLGDEKATLIEFIRFQRLTLELKCTGLDAAQLASRSVEPSTMSLLGLIRHMAEVERTWFKRRLANLDVPRLYQTDDDPDGDFNGAVVDDDVVADAWRNWREEVAFSAKYVEEATDLGQVYDVPNHGQLSLREVLVHMVEEYARHVGHADLLRERIDGRIGQ
jgi:uncharacterized damage-inducible protein DinB